MQGWDCYILIPPRALDALKSIRKECFLLMVLPYAVQRHGFHFCNHNQIEDNTLRLP